MERGSECEEKQILRGKGGGGGDRKKPQKRTTKSPDRAVSPCADVHVPATVWPGGSQVRSTSSEGVAGVPGAAPVMGYAPARPHAAAADARRARSRMVLRYEKKRWSQKLGTKPRSPTELRSAAEAVLRHARTARVRVRARRKSAYVGREVSQEPTRGGGGGCILGEPS